MKEKANKPIKRSDPMTINSLNPLLLLGCSLITSISGSLAKALSRPSDSFVTVIFLWIRLGGPYELINQLFNSVT